MSALQPPLRTIKEVKETPRSAARSLWRTYGRNPGNFLTDRFWPWLTNYLRVALMPKRRLRTYAQLTSTSPGVFRIPDRCVIGMAGDWGTGTRSAYRVADQLASYQPHFTIHLGDVYYSGTAEEFRKYFIPSWPRGKLGTYVLNANHEMYSGGEGYFDVALPEYRQETSYFCLENDSWRILAVDSGYYSRTFPILELLLTSWIRLPAPVQAWLKEVVFRDPQDRRPVVLLSHHQWFSEFDTEYTRVGSNLAPYLDKVLLWLWAHEHRFAAYAPFALDDLRKVRARCIGHGGMPIELNGERKRARNLVFVDAREAPDKLDGEPIGYCGFAVLTLDGEALRVEYADETGKKLFEERWTRTAQGAHGSVVFASPDLSVVPGASLESLVS